MISFNAILVIWAWIYQPKAMDNFMSSIMIHWYNYTQNSGGLEMVQNILFKSFFDVDKYSNRKVISNIWLLIYFKTLWKHCYHSVKRDLYVSMK